MAAPWRREVEKRKQKPVQFELSWHKSQPWSESSFREKDECTEDKRKPQLWLWPPFKRRIQIQEEEMVTPELGL